MSNFTFYRLQMEIVGTLSPQLKTPALATGAGEQKERSVAAQSSLVALDNRLFVSKYQLHLPKAEGLRRELERTLKAEAAK